MAPQRRESLGERVEREMQISPLLLAAVLVGVIAVLAWQGRGALHSLHQIGVVGAAPQSSPAPGSPSPAAARPLSFLGGLVTIPAIPPLPAWWWLPAVVVAFAGFAAVIIRWRHLIAHPMRCALIALPIEVAAGCLDRLTQAAVGLLGIAAPAPSLAWLAFAALPGVLALVAVVPQVGRLAARWLPGVGKRVRLVALTSGAEALSWKPEEEAARWARSCPSLGWRGWLIGGSEVTFSLEPAGAGKAAYVFVVPTALEGRIRNQVPNGINLRRAEEVLPEPSSASTAKRVRARLVYARPDHLPLVIEQAGASRAALQSFVTPFGRLEEGESLRVAVRARKIGWRVGSLLERYWLSKVSREQANQDDQAALDRKAVSQKIENSATVYRCAIEVEAISEDADRAHGLVDDVCGAFAAWNGRNQLVRVRSNLAQRVRAALSTSRRNILSQWELLAWVLPPSSLTKGVLRQEDVATPSQSLIPYVAEGENASNPRAVPLGTFRRGREDVDLAFLPKDEEEEASVLCVGQSGSGKSSLMDTGPVLHSIRRQRAFVFLADPHRKEAMRSYWLLPEEEREWVTLVDLMGGAEEIPALNPLDVTGCESEDDYDEVVTRAVDAVFGMIFSSTVRADRVRSVLERAIGALVAVNRHVPADRQMTIYQLESWADSGFRERYLPLLPERAQRYWLEGFKGEESKSYQSITARLNMLQRRPALRLFLGRPQTTLDVHAHVTEGRSIFLVPPSKAREDMITASIVAGQVIASVRSRALLTPEQLNTLPRVRIVIDELPAAIYVLGPIVDEVSRELRKFHCSVWGFAQGAGMLGGYLETMLTNRTVLLAGNQSDTDAKRLVREMGGKVFGLRDTKLVSQRPHHFIVQVRREEPFELVSIRPERIYGEPEVDPERVESRKVTAPRTEEYEEQLGLHVIHGTGTGEDAAQPEVPAGMRICPGCGGPVRRRKGAKWCSEPCRQRAKRNREAGPAAPEAPAPEEESA